MNPQPIPPYFAVEIPKYLTTAEVGAMLRTPGETIRYWRNVGKGPKSFRAGRKVLYALEDVEAWIAQARGGEAA